MNWTSLFSPAGFMPRLRCGAWDPALIRLTITSDATIAACYLAIPVTIFYILMKRRRQPRADRQPVWTSLVAACFALFILFCGWTHVDEILVFWFPMYRFFAVVKALTAMASVGTVGAILVYLPGTLAQWSAERIAVDHYRTQYEGMAEILKKGEQFETELVALLTERDSLAIAQEMTKTGSWQLTIATGDVTWSASLYALLGADPHQRVPNFHAPDHALLFHPDDASSALTAIASAIAEGRDYTLTFRANPSRRRGDVWFRASGLPRTDEQGVVTHYYGTLQELARTPPKGTRDA